MLLGARFWGGSKIHLPASSTQVPEAESGLRGLSLSGLNYNMHTGTVARSPKPQRPGEQGMGLNSDLGSGWAERVGAKRRGVGSYFPG